MTKRFQSAAWLWGGVYAYLLYLQAATASLYDYYLPGVESVRFLCRPEWFLLVVMLLRWLLPKRVPVVLLKKLLLMAMIACVLLLSWMMFDKLGFTSRSSNLQYVRDSQSLVHGLWYSLSHPSFSNRSLITTGCSLVVAAVSYVLLAVFSDGARKT